MNEISKNGLFLFIRILIVGIMCAITTVSIFFLFTAISTEKVGYNVTVTDKDGKKIISYDSYDKDGEDTKIAEYEKEGYSVNKTTLRSTMSKTSNRVCTIISQVISLSILCVFIYGKLFGIGNKDRNLVNCKNKEEDKLKGLKIGFFATIPSYITYLALLIIKFAVKTELSVSFYSVINMPYFQMFRAIYDQDIMITDLGIIKIVLLVLPLFIVPIVSHICYTLGYKDIFILQKIVYKNKEGATK